MTKRKQTRKPRYVYIHYAYDDVDEAPIIEASSDPIVPDEGVVYRWTPTGETENGSEVFGDNELYAMGGIRVIQ